MAGKRILQTLDSLGIFNARMIFANGATNGIILPFGGDGAQFPLVGGADIFQVLDVRWLWKVFRTVTVSHRPNR